MSGPLEYRVQRQPLEQRHFFRGQVRPRLGQILLRPRVAVVLLLGVLTGALVPHLPMGRLRVSELASAGLAFAALSFGACVTGAVLALTLPAAEARRWAGIKAPDRTHSTYSDLIFTFTWSGVAQLGVVVSCALAFLFGGDKVVSPAHPWFTNKLCVGVAALVFYYALAQLLTVLGTISQIGFALIAGWAKADEEGTTP